MLMVGLTGGIGAGKSAVATRLVRRGAVLIDADRLAREVVAAGTDGATEVVAAFGPGVLGADGELDRPALAARVFGDEAARGTLEGIIHPRVRARTAELAAVAPADAVVVSDVPLLVEAGLAPSYHLVIVVAADQDVRVRRLVEQRGMAPEQALARIAAQTSDERRRCAADVLLCNDGGWERLDEFVDALWWRRLRPYEENLRRRCPVPHDPTVRVVAPDPDWPGQAARLIARIRHALGPVAVEHIGATAVPQLPAEDVVDLMLAVPTLAEADAVADALAQVGLPRRAGACCDPARDGPEPARLHGSADPGRPVNLQVRLAGSAGWRFALLMRDHLRALPAARDAYAAAKRRWVARRPGRADYLAAKQSWFEAERVAAQQWAEAAGWRPGVG